jgi:hypothetical protein
MRREILKLIGVCVATALSAPVAFGQRGIFAPSESKYVIAQVVDMSGSFAEKMADKGQAFQFTTGMIDRYFRARVGTPDRLIIGQISGGEALVWEGLPLQLRRQYTPETFGRFLRANSDPNGGSPVYDSVAQAIEYILDDPAIKSGQAKSAVLICSDMLENSPGAAEAEKRLTKALTAYGRIGGVVGIYYCNQRLVAEWRKRLRDAGIREFKVESAIVGKPTFPSFED